MKVSYQEVGIETVTFPNKRATEGKLVKITTDGTENCADGDKFAGLVHTAEPMYASVQLHGFVTVPYSGTAPSYGFVNLLADGTGGVKVGSTGRSHLVVNVNRTAGTVTFEL